MLRIKKSLLTMFSHQWAGSYGAHRIKTAIAADSSPVPTAHSSFTSRTRVPGPTFCCLGGGPVSSPALMASRFRVPSGACGFGAYSCSVDPNLPLLGTGSQFDTLSAGLRSNLSVLEGPESAHLPRCRMSRRRSPHRTRSGRSASAMGRAQNAPYPTSTTSPKTRRMGWKTVVEHATCYWIVLGTRRQDNLTRIPRMRRRFLSELDAVRD